MKKQNFFGAAFLLIIVALQIALSETYSNWNLLFQEDFWNPTLIIIGIMIVVIELVDNQSLQFFKEAGIEKKKIVWDKIGSILGILMASYLVFCITVIAKLNAPIGMIIISVLFIHQIIQGRNSRYYPTNYSPKDFNIEKMNSVEMPEKEKQFCIKIMQDLQKRDKEWKRVGLYKYRKDYGVILNLKEERMIILMQGYFLISPSFIKKFSKTIK